MAWETWRWPLILLNLWMISLIGIHSIPLESHEVLVIETSREMQSQGEWVLPSFDYEPRLNKPPFSYWAVSALSCLDPSSAEVQIWHGRLISLLAGLVMVFATYHAGKTLFNPFIGKLASLLLLSMQGYIFFSHNARPDFLYSTLCVLQLFAWIHAWKTADGTARQRLYGWLGWGMAGLATLTKGPQVPAVFLAGMLVFLLRSPEWKRTLKVIRPFAGIAIWCLLVLPWWVLLQQHLQEIRIALSETQLSGSLLHRIASWQDILSCYYPLNLFSMMIPASLVIPFMIPWIWKALKEASAPMSMLLYASTTFLVLFTLGGHYRKHYLLPLLPMFSIVLASAIQAAAFPELQGIRKRAVMVLLALCAILCLGLMAWGKGYLSLLWIFLNSIPLWLLLRQELQDSSWDRTLFSSQMMKTSVILVILVTGCIAYFPSSQNQWRRSEQSFAESIGSILQAGDLVVHCKCNSFLIPFYAKRPITHFKEEGRLADYFQENQGTHRVYAILPKLELASFSSRFENVVLSAAESRRHPDKELVFVKLVALKNMQR
jgi:4-amino-4-deoxy-L-arabinose transferase-like glycosyltransferase